jgi:Kef-type K+ transport system membrane component KefB
VGVRLTQAFALAGTVAMVWAVSEVAPNFHGPAGLIASVGFLLLGGWLLSELLEVVGLPHLSGYLLMGILAGPHVLDLVGHVAVERLSNVNVLALTLIALAGGVELRIELLRSGFKGLFFGTLSQSLTLLVLMTTTFYFVGRELDFLQGLGSPAVLAIGVLWAVLAMSRSPSATLAILVQTRARGPLTNFALAFVMSSDIVVIVVLAAAMSLIRPVFDAASNASLSDLVVLGHEIVGSVTLGTNLGLLLALYLRLAGKNVLFVLLALAYGATEALSYLRFDPLLTFMIAGFVVQNFSRQGPKLLGAVERTGSVVFVLFFATAGAHLDLPLLGSMWQVALILCGARIAATFLAHRWASRAAGDPVHVQRWGWAPLVSQAGLTLGLSMMIERTFPEFGAGLGALVIATVAINELVGPILFKLALDRTGESRATLADSSGEEQAEEQAEASG